MTENETPSTAAEIRAMAEQAEAEAAEAEALAAAARARARAIQLRRRAQQVEETQLDEAPSEEAGESQAAAEQSEIEPEDAKTAVVETDTEADETVVDRQPDVRSSAGPELPTDQPAGLRGRRRPKLSTAAAVLAALVVIALSASSAWMILQHRHATRQHRLAAEFSAAARQGVVTLTSLDFNDAKGGVQHILDNSTGSFKDDFAKMAGDFTKVVEQSKVVERGTVQAVGVDLDSMTENSAVVLVASTSEVTNAAGAKQDPRTFRLIVTLTRDGDQLKMSKVEFVP